MRQPLAALLIALALLPAVPAHAEDAARARHVLDRLAFGPGPGDVERVAREGVDAYIREQLDASGPEPDALKAQLAEIEAINATPAQLYQRFNAGARGLNPEERKARRKAENQLEQSAARARLLRAVYSPHQLREVMVDFWYNHFNVFDGKGPERLWVGAYEEQAIRPNALGSFRDLVGAVAHHPAMLFYLDNWQSSGQPGRAGKSGKRQGLNENYARELMELHTLGVGGGYTQQDVIELARILTGWGFKPKPAEAEDGYSFFFNPRRHDGGTKVLLGQTFEPGGEDEGEKAIDLLVSQPATAQHLARQLAEYFVADDPPPALVAAVAERFQSSHGDIKATLDALFHRPEFWDPRYAGNKFKTPYQLVVSTARAVKPHAPTPERLLQSLKGFGQPLYGFITPDGYKNTQAAWLSPEAMTRRVTFAVAAAAGRLNQPGFPKQGLDPRALQAALGDPLGDASKAAVEAAPARLRSSLVLGSPEFNRR